jgi:ribosomal protein L16/L10AE
MGGQNYENPSNGRMSEAMDLTEQQIQAAEKLAMKHLNTSNAAAIMAIAQVIATNYATSTKGE